MEFLKCSPKWTREPKKYVIQDGKVVITTEKGTDLWARTYYGFQNDNAPCCRSVQKNNIFRLS